MFRIFKEEVVDLKANRPSMRRSQRGSLPLAVVDSGVDICKTNLIPFKSLKVDLKNIMFLALKPTLSLYNNQRTLTL